MTLLNRSFYVTSTNQKWIVSSIIKGTVNLTYLNRKGGFIVPIDEAEKMIRREVWKEIKP